MVEEQRILGIILSFIQYIRFSQQQQNFLVHRLPNRGQNRYNLLFIYKQTESASRG